jgi:PAS domain S-box-containing protein
LVRELALARQSGEPRPLRYELKIVTKAGEERWLDFTEGTFEFEGKPAVVGTALDITERKQAEIGLRKSERILREVEELGHTGSWEHDLVTGEIFNTEENIRLFFGEDRSKGKRFEDYVDALHPDDRAFVMGRHAHLLAEGGPRDIEFRVVWPDGSVHVLVGRATVVRDQSGQALRVYGTNVDITERKRAQDHLRLVIDRIPLWRGVFGLTAWLISSISVGWTIPALPWSGMFKTRQARFIPKTFQES